MNKLISIKDLKLKTRYSDSTIRRFLKGLTETERRNHTTTKGNRIYIDSDFFLSHIESKRIKSGKELVLNDSGTNQNLIIKLIQDQDQRIKELNEWIEKLIRSNEQKEQVLNEKDKTIQMLMNKILSSEERIRELSAPKQTGSNPNQNKTFNFYAAGLILVLILLLIYLITE